MASVAEQLRTAREAQNLTIQQIAQITNVRADHIRAIEEGNYDVFSAPVYIRGFVRTYCKILKLDGVEVIEVDVNSGTARAIGTGTESAASLSAKRLAALGGSEPQLRPIRRTKGAMRQ